MSGDSFLVKALLRGVRVGGNGADGSFLHSIHGFDHCLSTVSQTIYFAASRLVLAGVVFVESRVDALQDCFERDAGFAPGFDQRPVQGGKQSQRAAASLEMLLNLGEVV